MSYFNLTRLWGNVALVLTVQKTDEARANSRSNSAQVYQQIISDLTDAASKLPTAWPDAQRGRATSYAANALLAKVYLYQKNYAMVASTLQPIVMAIFAGISAFRSIYPVPQAEIDNVNNKTGWQNTCY